MSGWMYAGKLCATQIGGQIEMGDRPLSVRSPCLVKIIHGKHKRNRNADRPEGVMVVIRWRDGDQTREAARFLFEDDVVRVEDPST